MTVVSARRLAVGVALSAALAGLAAAPASGSVTSHSSPANTSDSSEKAAAEHVLLISVDGLHQSDLAWYVAKNPGSNLAKLAANGVDYSNASTPFPSDSYPGIVGQVTGGNPSSTGVYYDDSWNSSLFPPGTTNCSGKAPGAEVTYMEAIAKNPGALDSGQGIAPPPGSPPPADPWKNILQLSSNPKDLINPAKLPVDPKTCKPIYPNEYLKVNTIFEVAKQHQLLTAWSDKHAAYQIVAGPSGAGVDDFFTPEINSSANPAAPADSSQDDWTKDNLNTQKYDGYKVQAVLNWIAGHKHDGSASPGTPAIFGMNFQSVSTAQKLPTSKTEGDMSGTAKGGYMADGFTPEKVLSNALDYVDGAIGKMVEALKAGNLYDKTAIIISAKHGQSPMNPAALNRIDDGKITKALNAAWSKDHPGGDLVAFSVNDDGMLLWLTNHSQEAADFAKAFLQKYNDSTASVDSKPVTSAGLTQIYAGEEAANLFNVEAGDPRVPDVVGIAQYGVVYTSKKGKISEHGGDNPQDRNVPILISGKSLPHNANVTKPVETTQIAPTILQLLGLNPEELKAVRIEGTESLLG